MNQAAIVATAQYQTMFIRPQLSYIDNNIIKGRVQRKKICLQTDQSEVMTFFDVIVRIT